MERCKEEREPDVRKEELREGRKLRHFRIERLEERIAPAGGTRSCADCCWGFKWGDHGKIIVVPCTGGGYP